MNVQVESDGKMMREDVDLDYENKYIKINGPAVESRTPAKLMYHTTEVTFSILSSIVI